MLDWIALSHHRRSTDLESFDWINALQWPAMAVTVAAAWMVGAQQKRRRLIGFVLFLLSNVLWIVWGWYAGAWALVVLQLALALTNTRGFIKNEPEPG